MQITCFKAYDIRGKIPDQLNPDVAYRIGRAFAEYLRPETVVVGQDVRLSSLDLKRAFSGGLIESGVNVLDIGLCGTEEVYYATSHIGAGGGVMITASHNPIDYNGMKLVREQSKPVSGDTGLETLRLLAEKGQWSESEKTGAIRVVNSKAAYIEHLLGYLDHNLLRPLKLVVNAGNGCAGPILDLLENHLPFKLVKICHQPDGSFPNGIPNPLLPENRSMTRNAVLEYDADLGLAWDGDFDRCFFFDECGRFVEGYYIVGLLASIFLKREKKAKVILDPRLTWNTIDIVHQSGGIPVISKTGHAFIKERMRSEDAVYGGEMSAHHYFRDFSYCDSGMIPWLLIVEIMCRENKPLSQLINERIEMFPASGEINRTLADPAAAIAAVEKEYGENAKEVKRIDGLSVEFQEWRFNLRLSNTEPVVRLNVETRSNQSLLEQKTKELLCFLDKYK